MPRTTWNVEFHPACEEWADQLDQGDAEALLAAIRVLRDEGPNLVVVREQSPIFRATGYFPILPLAFREKAMALRSGGDIEAS